MEIYRVIQIISSLFKICFILLLVLEYVSKATVLAKINAILEKKDQIKDRNANILDSTFLIPHKRQKRALGRERSHIRTPGKNSKRRTYISKRKESLHTNLEKYVNPKFEKYVNPAFEKYEKPTSNYHRTKKSELTNKCTKNGIIILPGIKPLVINFNDNSETDIAKLNDIIYDDEEINTNIICKKVYFIIIKPNYKKHLEKDVIIDELRTFTNENDLAKQKYEETRKVYVLGVGDDSCETKEDSGRNPSDIYYDSSDSCQQRKPTTTPKPTTTTQKLLIHTTKRQRIVTTKPRTTTTKTKPIIKTTKKPIDQKRSDEFTGSDLDAIAPPSWEEKAQGG